MDKAFSLATEILTRSGLFAGLFRWNFCFPFAPGIFNLCPQ
jgi:hypothetical protein